MKRLAALLLALCLCCAFALAEETAEYSDSIYSFRYPSSWDLGYANDGSVILMSPAGNSAIMTFSLSSDMIAFTGDETHDRGIVETIIAGYSGQSGKSTRLNGEYEPISFSGLTGFRAFGTWSGSMDLHMDFLSDGRVMIGFSFIGSAALAREEAILASVMTAERETVQVSGDGLARWQGDGFSVSYPDSYGTLEMTGGVAFMLREGETVTDTIMARTYALDVDYSDSLAPAIASAYLPKSAKLEADPVMEQIGPWNAAVIRGDTDSGPLAFCIIGSGRTALGLLFLGNDAVTRAEAVVSSASID